MTGDRPLVVVGGGPAGMAAALAAAECGVDTTLLDEGIDLGGQIHRAPTRPTAVPPPHPRGEELRRRVAAAGDRIEVRRGALVWGMFDGTRVAVTDRSAAAPSGGGGALLAPRCVVLAPGAHERVPPFPGWTLPGVLTPGAAQILMKTMGVAPGRRVLVAGSGPFLLVVAGLLAKSGVHVVGVLEASPRAPWWTLPLHGWRTRGLLLEGVRLLATLRRAGVPVHYGRMVIAAEGTEALRSVVHAPVDADWVPDSTGARTEDVDALLVGYGFVPRVELAQMAGCRLEFRDEVGGWVPVRDGELATTVPGVFAAGDGAGVAGAIVAEAEGRLAGLAAAARLGALDAGAFAAARSPIDRTLRRLAPLRRALDLISAPRRGLTTLVEDDTVVCRCEEVRWSTVRTAIRSGCRSHRSLRVATRVGMGACQGRFCWPSVACLAAGELGCATEALGPAGFRPPARPITLGELAASPPGKP